MKIKNYIEKLLRFKKWIFVSLILFVAICSLRVNELEITGQLEGFHSTDAQIFKDAKEYDSLFTNTKDRIFISITPEANAGFDFLFTCDEIESDLRKLNEKVTFQGPKIPIRKYYILVDQSHTLPIRSVLSSLAENLALAKLISKNKQSFIIIASFPDGNIPVDKLNEVLNKKRKGLKNVHHFGLRPLEKSIEKSIKDDILLIAGSVILFFTFYVFWVYRSISAIIFSTISMGLSIWITTCLFPWLDIKITVLTVLALPVVLVLSLSDSIHILSALSKENNKLEVISKLIVPSFLSSLTTSLAFFTFFFSDAPSIRSLGLVTGISVLLEFFVSFALVFSIISWINVRQKPPILLFKITDFIIRKRIPFSIGLAFLVIGSIFLLSDLSFESDTKVFFPDGEKITQDHHYLNDQYHVQIACYVWFKNTRKLPQEKFNKLIDERLNSFSKNKKVIEIARTGMEENKPISLSKNEDSSIVLAELNFKNTQDIVLFYNEMNQKKLLQSDQMDIHCYSQFIVFDYINQRLAKTLFLSLLTSGLAIILMLFMITRSLKQSLVGFIPNLVPLSIVVWIFYLFGFELNLLTAMTSVVCIGLLDDDTIHILYRKYILKQAPESLTYSIVNTAILLSIGFALFMLSNFEPTRIFGGVSALVFIFGILGELTLFQWVLDLISAKKMNYD